MDDTLVSTFDYTLQLDNIIEILSDIQLVTHVILNVMLFVLGSAVAIGVCYFLYKAIKQLF